MNLNSFELNLLPDSGASRFLSRLQLASWNGSSYDSFYDSGVNGFTLGVTSFPVTLTNPVQASQWQAVFTNRTENFVGARIVELDGFGSLATSSDVPEPSSMGLGMSGLALLALAARRKSRK
jgi:MYXO-CTERM domain-containing protein